MVGVGHLMKMTQILVQIGERQAPALDAASDRMAEAIAAANFVHFYGSGRSPRDRGGAGAPVGVGDRRGDVRALRL